MRNLELCDVVVRDIQVSSEETPAFCLGHDEGSSFSELYVCTNNPSLHVFNEKDEVKWNKDVSHLVSPDNCPMNVTFLSLQNSVCVGFENGELLSVTEAGTVCEVVGVFDVGILAMEWSPDQELLAIVTKELNMVLLSCTFDPVNEVNLLNAEFGEKQFITVGWGKKETQFHGSEGKQAAKLQREVSADPNASSDNKVKLTWRGDGSLYAVGFKLDGIRRFKVFDREGRLQYTSEKQQGLESNLSWRPSGNVIATTQKVNDKYILSFFEKNGLKHGEFEITVNSTTYVKNITWSLDSEILTLHCKDIETNTHKLLLYTSANYHWYLKQTLLFNSKQDITKIMWDNDFDVANNKKLHIILNDGSYLIYSWIWTIDHSKGISTDDDAVVAVIDGCKLLVTGFRQAVVPPPMSSFETVLDASVNSVCFAPQKSQNGLSSNSFFVCTVNNKLIYYTQTQKFPLKYEISKTVQLSRNDFPFQYYNWYWLSSELIVCVMVKNKSYYLIEFTIDGSKITQTETTSLPSCVTRIASNPKDSSKLFLLLSNGEILQYQAGGFIEEQYVSFNVSCTKFNVFIIEDELHFIGLTHKGNLYIGNRMIMNNVSSFFIHTDFLLLTTLQHVLLCVKLTPHGLNAISEYQKSESNLVYKRKIERGTKLVIVVPNDTRTVFQMPRGNLESIQPRPLSLKIIGQCLDALKYHEAFDLMRKQRINLNLIYDHDPEKFITNIDVFLDSIENNSWLNLFLSDLENFDVTQTMYSSNYETREVNKEIKIKVIKICDAITEQLRKRADRAGRILPIITTYVKKNTVEDLEKALTIIKDLKLKETNGKKLPVGSDEALKYLLYMVDVNHLFDVALGMYDFDLVLLVANKSQKDPKEYIPMLNELNEMDENFKCFSINKHLKRFDKAVESLVQCGPSRHEELKTFVKYHSLYGEALALLSIDDEIYKQISEDYGLYLKLKKHFTKAGIIYERANNIDKAIECYKDALEWELALKLASNWAEDQFKTLCWYFINGLKNEKRHNEALSILEQYYSDPDGTISYAVECGHYKTALRLCSQYSKPNLRDELLTPTLLEDFKNMTDLIETNWCTFIRHRDRLEVVRANKIKNPIDVYDFYVNKDSDLYSDAGSTLASSSRGSSRSYRSSKNRRKHERKVASLKEGSQYEDVALIMALHSHVTASFELRLQVKEIVTVLSCLNKDKEAHILQSSLEKLLKEMKDSFKDIWTNELVIESTNAFITAQDVPEGVSFIPQGIASLEPHIRIAPVIHEINWKLDGLK
ncbi:hypothetical protein O3G_MSEX003635 [Manduca sexta]|uniref:Elongator complex protein 1 n=2 Tax=Manduca sexta TaxID=7130 RepID=A0A921YSX4_MANSE|nr:hypothetical protein O3G_MSEX003635 [Manduca sexta]